MEKKIKFYFGLEKKWDINNRSLGQILLYYGYFAYYAYYAFSRHPSGDDAPGIFGEKKKLEQ